MLAEALASRRTAAVIASRLAALSEGNPFFLLQIVRAVKESGVLGRHADGSWTLVGRPEDLRAPPHLRELIGRFRAGASALGLRLMPSETAIQPLLLGEAATWPMALSGCAILGGIGLVIWKKA